MGITLTLAQEAYFDTYANHSKATDSASLDQAYADFLKVLKETESSTSKVTILYVCEPIREHAYLKYGNERHWGYTEEDALKYFLENIPTIFLVSNKHYLVKNNIIGAIKLPLGTYIKVIKKAIKTKKLDRHLEIKIPDEIYEELLGMFENE